MVDGHPVAWLSRGRYHQTAGTESECKIRRISHHLCSRPDGRAERPADRIKMALHRRSSHGRSFEPTDIFCNWNLRTCRPQSERRSDTAGHTLEVRLQRYQSHYGNSVRG